MRSFVQASRRRTVAAVGALALVGSVAVVAGPAAQAVALAPVSSVSRTGANLGGYCATAGGLDPVVRSPVQLLRLTVSPAAPRAGQRMTIKVFVKQRQVTPAGQAYPKGFLRGEVGVVVNGHGQALIGPVNARPISGAIFPAGWTAQATVKAPAAGKRAIVVNRIVYNVRGAGNGGWGTPYQGFDLVCSGGANPVSAPVAYKQPRLVLAVRKA